MSEWIIKRNGQGGQTVENVCPCGSPEYHGEWMGDEYVLVDVKSAVPVDFHLNDYLTYRGENYYLSYDPNVVKKARRGSYGEGFTYDNIKLYAIGRKLKTIDFKDVVLHGEDHKKLAYTSLSEFSFFAGSVEDLADRLQANLSRDGEGWNVLTPNWTNCKARGITQSLWEKYYNDPSTYGTWNDGTDGVTLGETDINITVTSDQRCSDVLKFAYEQFGLAFYVKGTDIVIGGVPIREMHIFRYGLGNGLYEIERTSEEDQELVTKVWGYGSEKNLPLNYYCGLHRKATFLAKVVRSDGVTTYVGTFIPWSSITRGFTQRAGSFYTVTLSYNGVSALFRATGSAYDVNVLRGFPELWSDVEYLKFFPVNASGIGLPNLPAGWEDIGFDSKVVIEAGADTNLWPQELVEDESDYPDLLSINKLMLPGFPDMSLYAWLTGVANGSITGGDAGGMSAEDAADLLTKYDFSTNAHDPWVQSKNAAIIGTLEGVVNFDGSSQTEIYPTIENTTSNTVYIGSDIQDNGYLDEKGEGDFTISVRRGIGYLDWEEALATAPDRSSVYIEMTSGYCVGRKFKVKEVKSTTLSATNLWELTCEREPDSSLHRYFPYFYDEESRYCQVRQDDTFVVTGIQMPDLYIRYASVKLLIAVCGWLDKRDHVRYTYVPKIDEIWMARQHDEAEAGTSLHDTLKAGMQFQFEDAADLGIERYEGNGHTAPYIDNITIKEDGNNGIPTYDVVLRDEKEKGTLDKLADNVSQLMGATDPTERNERVVEYVEYGAWSPLVDYYYETLNVAENRLETSRVWHYGILWECRRSFTREEPCYGCQDWTEVGGDLAYHIYLYDENDVAVGSSLLVAKGSVNETVKGTVFRGQEDVSDRVSTWSWDIIGADGTIFRNVANTRQITITDAMLPASWNTYGNVSFVCNATIAGETLPVTLKMANFDITSYEVEFSGYVDVITVDDVGNVIGGLWTSSGNNNEHRSYRIHSAISVRKNGIPLLYTPPTGTEEEGDDETATSGHYKIYGEGHGCSFVIEDSTLYITGIDHIKDGVPGSPDDVDFDYDAMRLIESCSVDLVIDCEGVGSIQKVFPVTIKHDSQPFVGADLNNTMSSVSWNTKTQSYVGLPIVMDFAMWHNDKFLDIEDTSDVALTTTTQGVVLVDYDTTINLNQNVIYYRKAIVTLTANAGTPNEYNYKVARITLLNAGKEIPLVTKIDITCSAIYSGIQYERTLTHTLNKGTDVNVYSLVTEPSDVVIDDGDLSDDSVSCTVFCDSTDDKHYPVTLDANGKNTTHRLMLCYQRDIDATESAYTGEVEIDDSVKLVTFTLYGLDANGNKDTSTVHDIEDVPVLTAGKDGVSVQSYIQVQEAWGDSASEHPSGENIWQDSTPTKDGKYLWRRTRKMVLNSEGTAYEPDALEGDWKYQRLSGIDGTSIAVKGEVVCVKASSDPWPTTGLHDGDLGIIITSDSVYEYESLGSHWLGTITASDGDAYKNSADGHLWMWSDEAERWIDLGKFEGDPGTTYFTHIAWADDANGEYSGTIPAGQISIPNKGWVGNFSIAPMEGYGWMGVLINTADPSDDDDYEDDPTYPLLYTWQDVKGEKGDSFTVKTNLPSVTIPANASSTTIAAGAMTFSAFNNGVAVSKYFALFKQKGSTLTLVPGFYRTQAGTTWNPYIALTVSTSDTDALVCRIYSSPTSASTSALDDYQAEVVMFVIKAGDNSVSWLFEASVDHFRFTRDYAGVLTSKPASTILRAVRSVGGERTVYDTDSSVLPTGIKLGWVDPSPRTWQMPPNLGTMTAATLMTNGTTFYENTSVGLYDGGTVQSDFTVTGGRLLGMVTFTAEIVPQRMLVPAGEFVKNAHQTKYYYLTERTCPLVLYNGEYWYLVAESASTNCQADQTNEPRTNNVSKWQKAEEYEVILTKMLFALFAKLGSFIVYGDYFYSQYGTLFLTDHDDNTEVIPVDATNYASDYTSEDGTTSVPYGFFSYVDPMPTTAPAYEGRFRPALCLNAKTGEAWFAQGKVHMDSLGNVSVEGTVKANNLYRRAAFYMPWGEERRAFVTDNDLAPNKVMEWFYMLQDYPSVSPVLYEGQMYSMKEIVDVGVNVDAIYQHEDYFRPCAGYADFVAICDRMYQQVVSWGQGDFAYLPPASLFVGKTITVTSFTDVSINIGDAPGEGIISYPYVERNENDPSDVTLLAGGAYNVSSNIPLSPSASLSFYSIGARWMALKRT